MHTYELALMVFQRLSISPTPNPIALLTHCFFYHSLRLGHWKCESPFYFNDDIKYSSNLWHDSSPYAQRCWVRVNWNYSVSHKIVASCAATLECNTIFCREWNRWFVKFRTHWTTPLEYFVEIEQCWNWTASHLGLYSTIFLGFCCKHSYVLWCCCQRWTMLHSQNE